MSGLSKGILKRLKRCFRNRSKVFVVGLNKTGTTSMAVALDSLGYKLGDQVAAELLYDDWHEGRFGRIIELCRDADAFQDIPFSLDLSYRELDKAFPGSKFILTVRDSADVWFESLTRFHTKIIGKNRIPTMEDMAEFPYRAKGWFLRSHLEVFKVTKETLYDRAHYTSYYESHNRKVTNYFKGRPDDFMVLNVADDDAALRLCTFLGKPGKLKSMPHENQSK